ncbi:phage tail sheath subtilisin-like domain-containing protein [Phormidium sp. CLA17]|uniref:phage tail sheath family protein n=1 Tax=Leptolyngbya sp. Cla-17 TaxID=2803751 RepID=UPI0018D7CDB9|nr:phage tail sheath subtilisin-like domain-containing protein [Leptolyngbya sp. Cla-17]MBM0740390.1 phage tail sheath subtilisin-like domain-containing protein [Leptolyngbya sp. Cla-17]
MPEYLAPGVYVEETSFRSKSIEGVGTSTTGFVGATRYGPTEGEPELMTSFGQFERIYGGLDPLLYGADEVPNYLAHAVRNFFDNGGSRLYVSRAYQPPSEVIDGRARAAIPAPTPEIGAVDGVAIAATNTVLSALATTVTRLQTARAAAIAILQFAVGRVLAVVDPPAIPEPPLNYNYANANPDIGTQLNTFINGLPVGSDRTTLAEAFSNLWDDIINAADDALQSANTQRPTVATAQTAIVAAYAAGVTAGTSTSLVGVSPDLPALTTAGTTVTTGATGIRNGAAGLATLVTTLNTALTAMNDEVTAGTANTALGALVAAIAPVITATTGMGTAITNAARRVTIERRLADVNAQANWLARFPGAAGDMAIAVNGRLGANVLTFDSSTPPLPIVRQVRNGDLVVIQRSGTALIHSAIRSNNTWTFRPSTGSDLPLSSLNPSSDRLIPLAISVEIQMPGKFAQPQTLENLTLSGLPNRSRDSLSQLFAIEISNRLQAMETPVILQSADETVGDAQLAASLLGVTDWGQQVNAQGNPLIDAQGMPRLNLLQSVTYRLTGGSDGGQPEPIRYEGIEQDDPPVKSGLRALEDLEEIAIVAAPGYSYNWGTRRTDILAISQNLIVHCERMRYRVAVLDSPDNVSLSGVREYRSLLDTTRAAVYYPWVTVNDPISEQNLNLPPSGFMAGIYARSDTEIGVHKAPANEVVRNAIALEILINKAQQDILNPLGINCLRFFEGRGIRVWGARTVSSDPEWKYLNIRRYFAYLEASIDRATQWAVFEPNGERLWANVRRTVESFLETEWRSGRLAGTKVEEAFFVRCDRSTMTQNDLDNGRMICLIGVSPLYPAEFVIFRIGQWTGDRR